MSPYVYSFSVLLSCVPFLAAAGQSPGLGGAGATLQTGDALRISVWGVPELSGEFEVGPDSALKHPLYKNVKVAGVPLPVLEGRVSEYLRQFRNKPELSLEPLLRVVLGGEVRLPSIYSLPPEATVAEAVARAGGPSPNGRLDRVTLVRNGRRIAVNLHRPDSEAARSTVHSGDQILVGRRRNLLREVIAPTVTFAASVTSMIFVIRRY
jgi:protein involved in polysaccharide export with SLBB domain